MIDPKVWDVLKRTHQFFQHLHDSIAAVAICSVDHWNVTEDDTLEMQRAAIRRKERGPIWEGGEYGLVLVAGTHGGGIHQ